MTQIRAALDRSASFVLALSSSYIQRRSAVTTVISSTRSARLVLRATPEQETVLRRAAEVAHKSVTDFILDAAYQAAELTLLDQRFFMVSGSQYQALLEMLDRPDSDNPGLAHLFSRRPVWGEVSDAVGAPAEGTYRSDSGAAQRRA
jgi:uncharacterized protein (DUF1778 family)